MWAKRRHPAKSRKWVKARYCRDDGYWTFWEGKAELVDGEIVCMPPTGDEPGYAGDVWVYPPEQRKRRIAL
jgi:hypothetical protein